MGAEKTLVKVNKGQDAYSVIGNYIFNHITVIEDIIAVIRVNGTILKELYMADVKDDGYFYWYSDWWEGEEDVALVDFFPVSDAVRFQLACTELLTDGEKRLFLAAMGREIKICKQVDKEHVLKMKYPLVSLVHMCNEIERKVKSALF